MGPFTDLATHLLPLYFGLRQPITHDPLHDLLLLPHRQVSADFGFRRHLHSSVRVYLTVNFFSVLSATSHCQAERSEPKGILHDQKRK